MLWKYSTKPHFWNTIKTHWKVFSHTSRKQTLEMNNLKCFSPFPHKNWHCHLFDLAWYALKNKEETGCFIALKCLTTGVVVSFLLIALLSSVMRSFREQNVSPTCSLPQGHFITCTTLFNLHVIKSPMLTVFPVKG